MTEGCFWRLSQRPTAALAERRQGPRWCVGATHSLPLWTARLIVVSRGRADGSLSVLLMRSSGLSVAAWDRQPDYRDEGLSCCFQVLSGTVVHFPFFLLRSFVFHLWKGHKVLGGRLRRYVLLNDASESTRLLLSCGTKTIWSEGNLHAR